MHPSLVQLTTIGYINQLPFLLYANYVASHLLVVRERESGSTQARNCLYLLQKDWKLFLIFKTNNLYIPTNTEHVDELSFSQNKLQQPFSDS